MTVNTAGASSDALRTAGARKPESDGRCEGV